ncbi:MAG: hypothetical protein AAGF13_05515 [Pseudomonadota bacterium]
MPDYLNSNGCEGRPHGNERRVAGMGYDKTERSLLVIARFYFLTFSDPSSQGWMRASAAARAAFDEPHASYIAAAVLEAVNELRIARGSAFEFSNPDCPGCSQILCEAERQFMEALTAVRLGRVSAAYASAMLLCEGGNSVPLIAALERLRDLLSDVKTECPLASLQS